MAKSKQNSQIILWLVAIFLLTASGAARPNGNEQTPDSTATDKKKSKKEEAGKLPEFEKLIKDFDRIEGLFDIYVNEEEDKYYLSLSPDQLGETYLFNATRQSGDARIFDSGAMLGDFPFRFKKQGKRIQLIHLNTLYRAKDKTAMHRAVEHSLSNSIVNSVEIKSQPDSVTKRILVDLSDLFLTDKYTRVEYNTGQWKQKYSLDKKNSTFIELKSFPANTEIEVSLHYYSGKPYNSTTLADSRSMLMRYHYSLSTLSETDYKPRIADDRVGHFVTLFQDYSSVERETPYTYYINRWNLKKADPEAELSPPGKPIVYWIENTVPEKYRDAIRRGILLWNNAFERIGIKDAIIVRQMPDDADWDPADVRYNTVRWIVQPGGGYAVGPSRANPYTGEIYDADIRVSADFVRHFFTEYDQFITPLSLEEILRTTEVEAETPVGMQQCNYAAEKKEQMEFGWNLIQSRGLEGDVDYEKFVQDGLTDLIVHEVGHTLGLRHNFRASHIYPLGLLRDVKFTEDWGTTGSVMDYTPINLSKRGDEQGDYFQTALGVYDYWAIEYAYAEPEDTTELAEKQLLEDIAGRVGEPLLEFCTDSDANGYSIKGMDPSCSLYDMTTDPLSYYGQRLDLVRELWTSLSQEDLQKGESYQRYLKLFNQGIGEYRNMANNVTKYVGGMYVHRGHYGDTKDRLPFEVVPAEEQWRALKFLNESLFQPDAFDFPPALLNKLIPELRGDFSGSLWRRSRLEYPVHNAVLKLQGRALTRLYSTYVLNRLSDNELRFAPGAPAFSTADMFSYLRDNIWQEVDKGDNINSYRRELQRLHLEILIRLMLEKNKAYPQDAVSLALSDLTSLKLKIRRDVKIRQLNEITEAHLKECLMKIEAALTAKSQRNL
ncbi:MAG: DUF5117 domain-containing protein [FCB group bacterium]|nr:DUF5117 domain-containing protein [FCB group bacterium]